MRPNEITKIAGAVESAVATHFMHVISQLNRIEATGLALLTQPAAAAIPKFCRDCKHCVPYQRTVHRFVFFTRNVPDYGSALCGHPSKLSPVAGQPNEYCSVMRKTYAHIDTCGETAKWFEPK